MIEWIEFKNFKALRDAKLPLSRFTLIVGANGSGKSTALKGISALGKPQHLHGDGIRTAGLPRSEAVSITARWVEERGDYLVTVQWTPGVNGPSLKPVGRNELGYSDRLLPSLQRSLLFSLDATQC